ncbi:MAG TPA: hypothetical protein VGF71_13965 [Caulobacteraceae bacterium]|jgi:hypothetical protein
MKSRSLVIAAAATLALAAGAFAAHAEDGQPTLVAMTTDSDFASASAGGSPTTPRRTLEWNSAKGRWGLSLGVEQHDVGRDTELKDVSPGVYYRLSKRLHIGGAVNLAPDQPETLRLGQPQFPAPRVKLETVFKF